MERWNLNYICLMKRLILFKRIRLCVFKIKRPSINFQTINELRLKKRLMFNTMLILNIFKRFKISYNLETVPNEERIFF